MRGNRYAVAIVLASLATATAARSAPSLPAQRPIVTRPLCQSDPSFAGGVVGEVVRNPDPSYVSTIIVLPSGKDVDTYVSRLASTPMSPSFVAGLPGGMTGLRRMMSGGTSTIVQPNGHFVCYGLAPGKYTLLATMLQKPASGGANPSITYLVSRVLVPNPPKAGGGKPGSSAVTAPPFAIVGHTP